MQHATRKHYVRPTSKGQVTLPAKVRRALNIDPGTLLDVTIQGNRVVLAPVRVEEDNWESLIDFTEISPSGVPLDDIQRRLKSWTRLKKRSAN